MLSAIEKNEEEEEVGPSGNGDLLFSTRWPGKALMINWHFIEALKGVKELAMLLSLKEHSRLQEELGQRL